MGWILRHRGAFDQALEVERRAGIFDESLGRAFHPIPGEPDRILVVHPVGDERIVDTLRQAIEGQGYPLMHLFSAPLDLTDPEGPARIVHQYEVVKPSLVFAIGLPLVENGSLSTGLASVRG